MIPGELQDRYEADSGVNGGWGDSGLDPNMCRAGEVPNEAPDVRIERGDGVSCEAAKILRSEDFDMLA